jgi:hypothetical protein
MYYLKNILRAFVALGGCALLSGCFIKEVVKSELSSYDEPKQDGVAHLRVAGSRNVKVYPNSTCVSSDVPGSGYPAGPQMGGQRKRDLGMPKTLDMPGHFVEMAVRPGQPITAGFSFYFESQRPAAGRPGTVERGSASCYQARSFVPEPDQNYEMRAYWTSVGCSVEVTQLVISDTGSIERRAVASESAASCSVEQ